MQGAPMPVGTFKPNERGQVTMHHDMPPGTEAKAFGVTIENEGGATTPTMPIILSGNTGL
jgi:anti-sigma-K factor RskA